MPTESTPSLGLPGDIDANVAGIRSGADDLTGLRLSLTGQTEETDASFRSAAGEFSDLIGWNIGGAAADELMLWEDTTRNLTYGAATLNQWAQDVEDYRVNRASIQRRWDDAMAWRAPGVDYSILQDMLLEEHRGYWSTLLEQAQEASDSLRNGPSADALERMAMSGILTGTQLGYFGDTYPSMLPDGLPSPEDHSSVVNTWWNAMSEEEQREAMEDHPELLRSLDGIPSTVRDELNRDHLADEITRRNQEITELEEENENGLHGPGARSNELVNDNKIEELQEELETLEELQSNLDGDGGGDGEAQHHDEKFLLSLDTDGRGRAIVSHGNPDTADNVGTLVPGTTTTWQSVNDQMGRAGDLAWAAHNVDNDADHAVISWIGYDAPNIAEAAGPGRAEDAVDELSGFQDGLRATHENTSPARNTVLGHSYGSTVVGHTAQSDSGLNADEIVFVGSPGPNADHVEALGFAQEDVHASTAENDGISLLTGLTHGADPTNPDFGATVFASAAGTELPTGGERLKNPLGDAHSEYFQRDNPSLRYMGGVIAGNK